MVNQLLTAEQPILCADVLLRSCSLTYAELIEWSVKLRTFLRSFKIQKRHFLRFWVVAHVFANSGCNCRSQRNTQLWTETDYWKQVTWHTETAQTVKGDIAYKTHSQ